MIKSKFGDSLRSKTTTAQINEALCKVLAHNICCLIQSTYELNIRPEFGLMQRLDKSCYLIVLVKWMGCERGRIPIPKGVSHIIYTCSSYQVIYIFNIY